MSGVANQAASFSIQDVFLEIHPLLQKLITSRTKSVQVAQDLTQDIYLKVQSHARQFPTHDDARNYLIRIAINSSIDHMRTESRRKQLLQGSLELLDNYQPENKPESALLLKEQITAVDNALSALPEKCRQVLYLSRMEGLTHGEIAEKLAISKSSVEKYIIRALMHCRDNISL